MDLIKDFFLEAFPNPDRIDCPSEETLVALAEGRLVPGELTRFHVVSCSECYAEYRGYCLEFQKKRQTGFEIRKKEPSMKWSSIAADIRTDASNRPKPFEGVWLWLAAFKRRYSR
jgi:hypothetical protein